MTKQQSNSDRPSTKKDLDELAIQIISAVQEGLKEYPTKSELKAELQPVKTGIEELNKKFDKLDFEVSDNKRRIIDLESESVTKRDFEEHKRIGHTHS